MARYHSLRLHVEPIEHPAGNPCQIDGPYCEPATHRIEHALDQPGTYRRACDLCTANLIAYDESKDAASRSLRADGAAMTYEIFASNVDGPLDGGLETEAQAASWTRIYNYPAGVKTLAQVREIVRALVTSGAARRARAFKTGATLGRLVASYPAEEVIA